MHQRPAISTRTLLALHASIAFLLGLPFAALHLLARPDDAHITPLQHVAAAAANYVGPWGVALVRLVDFPNAGLRSFSWTAALGLTFCGAAILAVPILIKKRLVQFAFVFLWGLFVVFWFGAGFLQIASGLL